MAIYRVQRLFADQAQIDALQKKISTAQAAGQDTSALQRALTRAQGDMSKTAANTGRTMVAGQGIGATAIADTSNVKTAATNLENAAKSVQNSASQQSFLKGQNSVGIKQGAINTWNKMGTMGKVGTVGAGLLATGLVAKGLFGGSKEKQAAFSDDTNGALREAALLGTGLALTTGGVLAAKHGYLGKSAKNGYNKVSGKVKNIWHETNKFNNDAIKEGSKKPPKAHSGSKTPDVSPKPESGKKYPPEVWEKIKRYCRDKKLNFRDKKNQEIAAAAVGVK